MLDRSQQKSADIAYGCYLWIGTCFTIGWLVDLIYGTPKSSEEFAVLQGIGMLVVLPMALASLAASVLGLVNSCKLIAWWSSDLGLCILPLMLLSFVVVFAIEEQTPGPYQWLPYLEAAYVPLAFFFSLRWFLQRRKRR